MSPGGTGVSPLELLVVLVVAAALIAMITMLLRRSGDRQDLLGTQIREIQARAAPAASPDPDTRRRDAATRIVDARLHQTTSVEAPAEPASDALTSDVSAPTSVTARRDGDRGRCGRG